MEAVETEAKFVLKTTLEEIQGKIAEFEDDKDLIEDFKLEINNDVLEAYLTDKFGTNGNFKIEEDDENDYSEVFDKFISKHGFTRDLKTIYEYIVKGLTVKPFFQVIATDDDYARYIQACYDRSNIKTDVVVTPETDEQILTLSTCDSLLSATEGRLLVHAKMTERSRTPVQMPSQPAQGSSQESSQQ